MKLDSEFSFGGRPLARHATSVAVLASMLVLAGCEAKPADFFVPPSLVENTTPTVSDNTPPLFVNPFPVSSLTGPFAINSIHVDINDIIGSNGAAASGVDPSSVSASIGGESLPVTRNGNTYTASLTGLPDGQLGIVWNGKDVAGNRATSTMSLYLKNHGPAITIPAPPPATSQSNGASMPFSIGGTIADAYLFKATGSVLKPGPSNQCGNTDNTPWPSGTGPGQVAGNSWDYTSSVLSNGSFTLNANAFNPVSAGGAPTTLRYCFGVFAEDKATDGGGTAKHNMSVRYITVDQTWMPPAATFTLSSTATYRHLTTTSEVCVTINTTPAQLDQAYQLGISGPGVIGPTSLAGTLSSGSVVVRVPISQFGTYAGTVAVAGHTASYTVNVTSAAGTCT
ncbi:MAG TPA: hypothetical protein VGQ44_21875 [Gemmatimonadaceae bacterium]|jgi:hypothetical protein|nr:hypothetical protein [Gemmatimonadaceae bacterium]